MPLLMRIFFVLLGVIVVFGAPWVDRMRRRSATWPSVEGEITKCLIVSDDDDGHLQIAYRYRVGARTYQGKNLSYAYGMKQKFSAPTKYPVGQKVSVYYDPHKPSNAVLEHTDADLPHLSTVVIFGIVWIVISLLLP